MTVAPDAEPPEIAPPRQSGLRAEIIAALRDPAARADVIDAVRDDLPFLKALIAASDIELVKQAVGLPSRLLPVRRHYRRPPAPFNEVRLSDAALAELVAHFEFDTVLDVGAGAGQHAALFRRLGKAVTKLDFGTSVYARSSEADGIRTIVGDANAVELGERFDCVWASHILEHQPNANLFIRRLIAFAKPDGVIAITVPPLKFALVGGHLSLWTPGHLIYNLVVAGLDCSDARLFHYNYNITAIVRNRPAELPPLDYDVGDVTRLAALMPPNFREGVDGFRVAQPVGVQGFRIKRIMPRKTSAEPVGNVE